MGTMYRARVRIEGSCGRCHELTRNPEGGQDVTMEASGTQGPGSRLGGDGKSGELWVGLDVGTSRVKAAVWERDSGTRLATSQVPAPPLTDWHGVPVQDPEAVAQCAEAALRALGLPVSKRSPLSPGRSLSQPRLRLAFTTQRDTLLKIRKDGTPATPLLSWRARAHLDHLEHRAGLLDGGGASHPELTSHPELASRPRLALVDLLETVSLEGWLLRRWGAGIPVPGFEGVNPCESGGDKNCEYRALGVGDPRADSGLGVVSLGTAITLGMACTMGEMPVPPAGAVISPVWPAGAGRPTGAHGHAETGVLSGMGGMALAAERAGVTVPAHPHWVFSGWEDEILVFPHDGGTVDDLTRQGRVVAPTGTFAEGDAPHRLVQGWMQGVAAELERLRPAVEALAGVPLRAVWVTGGGATEGSGEGWRHVLRELLGVSVAVAEDPWLGCRGAIQILGEVPWMEPAVMPNEPHRPRRPEVHAWFERWRADLEASVSGQPSASPYR